MNIEDARPGETVANVSPNQHDESGQYDFRVSLTQRVFLVYAQSHPAPLDRRDVRDKLNIGDLGLDHAIRWLTDHKKIKAVKGSWGFYELVEGALMPEDMRGKDVRSRANLKRGRVACAA